MGVNCSYLLVSVSENKICKQSESQILQLQLYSNPFAHHIYNCTCNINIRIKDRTLFFCVHSPGVHSYIQALFYKSKYCGFGALWRRQISFKMATKVKATLAGK